ncbi:MAG: hypothetical protein IKL87_02540 [Oscillospiraceae bacterium]|nr:hypothetical protein [Oscillospiraceae bacterium]
MQQIFFACQNLSNPHSIKQPRDTHSVWNTHRLRHAIAICAIYSIFIRKGGFFTETVFQVASETYAEKTARLLDRSRIRYRMQKTTGPQGCTAKFTVILAPEQVFPLLRTHRIPFRTDL